MFKTVWARCSRWCSRRPGRGWRRSPTSVRCLRRPGSAARAGSWPRLPGMRRRGGCRRCWPGTSVGLAGGAAGRVTEAATHRAGAIQPSPETRTRIGHAPSQAVGLRWRARAAVMDASPADQHRRACPTEPGVLCQLLRAERVSPKGAPERIFTGRGIWNTPERARLPTCNVPVKSSACGMAPKIETTGPLLMQQRGRQAGRPRPDLGFGRARSMV